MASFGTVFDLFNDRELHLQDVYGNVEPLCMLVPYEEYKRHVLVYRLDTSAELFVADLQTLTERKAYKTGKELWTWCVQWEVDSNATQQPHATQQPRATQHLSKKPRLDSEQSDASTSQPSRQNAGQVAVRPCVIPPELMKQDDMQRILVDIVQVNAGVVPNFIEFLYRWVDFYLGDGKALKAALFREIPSLWDFEHHPRVVPKDAEKRVPSDTSQTKLANLNAEEVVKSSPTKKIRERPDLAAFERMVEQSERLQYREVRYGMQPPKVEEPFPPLVNTPQDDKERARYYAACFKSRQRALYMLTDVGVTPQNMRDYLQCQKENVKDTPFRKDVDGLFNYRRDAKLAQAGVLESEAHLRKQREIAISNRLAEEAQAAINQATAEQSSLPLIPPPPPRLHRQDVFSEMMRKLRTANTDQVHRIQIVPGPLVGKMDSEVFKNATTRQGMIDSLNRAVPPPHLNFGHQGPRMDAPWHRGTPLPTLPELPRLDLPPLPTLPALPSWPGLSLLPAPRPPTPGVPSPPLAPGFPQTYMSPGALPPSMEAPRLPPDFPLNFPSLGSEQLASASGSEPPRLQPNSAPGLPPLGHARERPAGQQEPGINGYHNHMNLFAQHQGRHTNLSPLNPPPNMQREPPITMTPPTPPANPQAGTPVYIYLPKVVLPANTIGPGGATLGDGGIAETDAFLIGYTKPGSGEIKITRAIFLPMGIWRKNSLKVKEGGANLLETYIPKAGRMSGVAHQAAYEKLKQAYNFIIRKPDDVRERELTKRWRVTNGPMTETKRGAVWEGWAVVVDREITMTKQERTGIVVFEAFVGGKDEAYLEKEARCRELEELMEEEEAMEDSDDSNSDDSNMSSGSDVFGLDDGSDSDDD